MLIGYARVSSNGQSLDLQLDELKKAGCSKIFSDKISGVNKKRPGLDEAISHLRKKDTFVIWKLDRLGRNLKGLIEDETKQMMAALNKSMGDNGLDESQFNRAFDRCWPELEVKLENIPSANSPASDQRSTDDLVREILVLVRELVRQNDSVVTIKKNLTDALYPLKSKEDAAMEALGIKRRRRAPISSEKGNPDSGLKL